MLTVTDRAVKKAKFLAEKEGVPAVVRLGVRGGGCSGLSYFYEFDANIKETDLVIEQDGLKITCDPKSLKYLSGTEFDFETNLLKSGFRFNNPNAKRSCSCGESFSL